MILKLDINELKALSQKTYILTKLLLYVKNPKSGNEALQFNIEKQNYFE